MGVENVLGDPASGRYGCLNELPQTVGLTATEIDALTVLET